MPNPALILETLNAYQRSAALKAAIELDVFSAIARGNRTAEEIAQTAGGSPRAVRILCDYLVIAGLLTKDGVQYSLTADTGMFLDRGSPAYIGSVVDFLLNPHLIAPYLNLAQVVRTGRTTLPEGGTVSHDNPIWVDFAKHMAPMIYPITLELADLVEGGDGRTRVLDIAAGHGLFGIAVAKRLPHAQITAQDWAHVLEVATANAEKAGVAGRYSTLPGDAFEVDFGGPYDVVLVTNFLHHFDPPTCEKLLVKIRAALAPGGRCFTLDFVPNDDRVSPPMPASFAMMMLGSTTSGDAYTFAEYETMFRNAGFAASRLHTMTRGPQSAIVSSVAA